MLIIVVPISVSIMLNLIFFLVIIRNICRRNRQLARLSNKYTSTSSSTRSLQSQTSYYDVRRQTWSLVLLIFNLGLSWATYLLYAADDMNYFAYLFIVLNGSQGLFFLLSQLLSYSAKKCGR